MIIVDTWRSKALLFVICRLTSFCEVLILFLITCSIFIEERLERLTKSISDLDVDLTHEHEVYLEDKVSSVSAENGSQELFNGTTESLSNSISERVSDGVIPKRHEIEMDSSKKGCDSPVDDMVSNKQDTQKHIPNAILPLLRYQQYDSSDSSSR